MPEHVHLLTTEPTRGTLATFLQIFKQRTSLQLKPEDQKQFWQRRYYDFNVSTNEKRTEKLRYIHRNPVVRGCKTRRLPPDPAFGHISDANFSLMLLMLAGLYLFLPDLYFNWRELTQSRA